MTLYTSEPFNPDSLSHQLVQTLYLDDGRIIWVGTYGGLSLVERGPSDELEFRTIADGPDGLPSPYVMSIAEDEAGDLWIATWGGGLVVLDPDTGEYAVHRRDLADSYSLAHDIAYALYEDRSGIIWVGTNGNGISKYDPGRRDFRFVHPELPEDQRLSVGRVQMLHEDQATGQLLIGVQNAGLNVRDPETGGITIHRHDPDDPGSIGDDNVTAALAEPDGSILLGTNAGISRYSPRTGEFESAWGPYARAAGSDATIVYALARSRDGSIWVGTYDRGLLRRMPDGTVASYRHDASDPRSLSSNLVFAIYEDSEGVLWVATNGGLNRYLPEVDGFRSYLHDPENPRSISSNSTARVLEDSAGTLWIASRSGGLVRYRRETDDFDFIGTSHGLSSNLVATFLEVAPDVLYVATTNGLNRVELDPLRVETIDERDGLYVREFAGS